MPRVPTADSFQATSTALPLSRLTVPSAPDIAGQETQQLGQGLMQAGGAAGRIAYDMQQTANQVRVDDALNKVKEQALRLTYDKDVGYTNLKGIDALQRPDGKPLAQEYGDKLQEHVDAVSQNLGNEEQRRLFAMHANDIKTSLVGQATNHEAGEFRTYALSVSDGVQSTALRDVELNWNNPPAIDAAVARIQAETYRQGKLLGKSAEWQEAQSRKLTSNAHKIALMSALEQNDPAYADAYLKKYSPQMDGDDILAVRGHITKQMDAQVGTSAANDVVRQMQPKLQGSESDRAFNILVGTESRGRQFGADGAPLTSSKGAVGAAQVMPDTAPEAAKLAGLQWDEQRYRNDPDYNLALGKAYFQKQLQDNGGDLAKAYAAYNAGPGRLQEAVKKAERSAKLAANDPSVQRLTWLDFMPPETRAYVQKNMGEYDAGSGQSARPTLQDIHDNLRSDPRLIGNPSRLKIALEESTRLYDETTKAMKQRDEDAVANAMRAGDAVNWRYSDLPASVRAAIPPKEVDNVLSYYQKRAKGDDTTSLWLYQKLTSNQAALTTMSDSAFYALRRELSEADFKHFANERAKLRGGASGSNGPGDLNTQAIKQSTDERLRMLGIDPTPKDDGGKDAQRIGGIRKFFNDYFLQAQAEAGKKFTDAEVAAHVDSLFAKNAELRGWFSNSKAPMLTMKASDVPTAEADKIKAAFKRQGNENPTDAQILDIYWKRRTIANE